MSQVFVCECGRKTTDPFVIRGKKLCVICAEDEMPDIVTRRERRNEYAYREHHVPTRRFGTSRD